MSGCQIKVRVEGDMAMVQFINMDWAAKFRGSGGQQLVEGCMLEVVKIVIVEEDESNIEIVDKNIESEDVGEEIVGSVAVRVRRKGGVSREGVGVREDFSLLLVGFLTFCLFCDFLYFVCCLCSSP